MASSKVLLANSVGKTVAFSLTNQSSTTDYQYTTTCTASGNVTITNCPITFLIGALQNQTKTVTFSVGAAGAGSVQFSVTSTNGGGSNSGTWTTTTVSPSATVSPNGTTVQVAPNQTGLSQAFTVVNTSRGAGTFALTNTCSAAAISGCALGPSSLVLDSAGVAANTGAATVTYNSIAAPGAGTIALTAAYGAATLATGTVNIHVMGATVTPTQTISTAPNFPGVSFTFQVENTGPSPGVFDLDFTTCSVVTNCRFSPSGATKSVMVTNGTANKLPVVVLFDTPASGTGTIALRARFNGVALSTATLTLTIVPLAPTVVAVANPTFVGPTAPGQIQVFNVTNNGPSASYSFTQNCAAMAAPAAATACSTPAAMTLATGVATPVSVTFTGGATKGSQSTMTLQATTAGVPTGSGSAAVVVPNPTVTAPAPVSVTGSASGLLSTFTVVNQGPVQTPFYFTASCTGSIPSCSVQSGATGTLAVGNSPFSVVVSYNTGAAGAATIVVQARVQGAAGPIVSTATQTVTVTSPQLPMVIDFTAAADSVLYRGQCIAVGLFQAASECGDLRIGHPLPSVRTMNTWRAPALVYNSAHAQPWIAVPFNGFLPVGAVVPTTVSAAIKINNIQRGPTQSWAGNLWTAGANRRLTVGFDNTVENLASGVYSYTLEVTTSFGGPTQTASRTGKLVVVDRRSSAFGAGWWLAGLEKLDLTVPALLTWIGGDGSVRQYKQKAGSTTVWGAPNMTYPDTLRKVGTEYIRQLPDSVWVYFDATGRHTKTRNRLGHVTSFGYDAQGRLQTITVPPAAAPLTYTFNYNANNHLSSVTAPGVPAARTVTVASDAATGKVTSITDPGAPSRVILFGYGSGLRITTRTNGKGAVATFGYDGAGKVKADTVVMAGGGKIGYKVTSLQSYGLSGATTLVDPGNVVFIVDGPRPENTVRFAVNGYGAPTQITDALSQVTGLVRTVGAFPGLVNQVNTVLGFSINAGYDAKGRLTSSSQISSTGTTATTGYLWDPGWDQIIKVTNPAGEVTDIGVGPAGNRAWQQDGRGVSSRTNFGYNGDNQIASVTLPLSNPTQFNYDIKGNLATSISGMDKVTTYSNDAIGRTTQVLVPVGLGPYDTPPKVSWTPFEVATMTYSDRNQELTRSTSLSGESVTATNTYDGEGIMTGVSRTWLPNQQGIPAQATSYVYDNANRLTRQTEADGTFEQRSLDAAGNVLSVTTRRGFAIGMGYDGLNRMTSRSIPGVTFGAPQFPAGTGITPLIPAIQLPYTYSRPTESQVFTYTADGQILTATGLDAAIARSYFPNGQLSGETQTIKTLNRAGSHAYTVGYTYDQNGRRRTLQLSPGGIFSGSLMSTNYDPVWGGVTSVTDQELPLVMARPTPGRWQKLPA